MSYDDRYLELTKKEFDRYYMVGCLCEYNSQDGPDGVVKIKVYGQVPDLKYCVLYKDEKTMKGSDTQDASLNNMDG